MQEHYFYFTRHGQTVWNLEDKVTGATDVPLTDQGRAQARALGERIQREGIHIDEIWYSPLQRAAETAHIVAEINGIPMRAEQRLIEQNFGKYEATWNQSQEFLLAKEAFADHYGNGESMMRLCQRTYNLLDELRDDDSGRIYLLVAHNGISRAVESYFHDMTNYDFANFRMKNCELKKYVF